MPKRAKLGDIKKAKKRILDLLVDLEDHLTAVGYAFDGVRTSAVPTVFESLLEALRLDGYDIDPIQFGDADNKHDREDHEGRPRPRTDGQSSTADINRREWKRWLKKSPRGSRGQRIFVQMRGPHAQAGIPGLGKRR